MVELRPVDIGNFDEVVELRVSREQEAFVLPNVYSIAQAKVQPECLPTAIYADGKPVGFLMYCIDRDDGEYWLYRLMIDERHQAKGYAREAMQLLIDKLRKDTIHRRMRLDVHKESVSAVRLYQNLGFVFTGQVFGTSHVMELQF